MNLFEAGTFGYTAYRIPALLATSAGRLIAWCEARRDSLSDTGRIDLVQRVSDDGGRTWSPQRVILSGSENTVGNPCPLEHAPSGRLFLFFNGNGGAVTEEEILKGNGTRTVGYMVSDDNGDSWSEPIDMTGTLSRPGWTWYACTPGHGLTMADGTLVVPCNHGELKKPEGACSPYVAHLLFSEDGGASWRIGAMGSPDTNETTAAELSDGTLYVNSRSFKGIGCRQACWSPDGGETMTPAEDVPELVEPCCEGAVLSVGDRLFFLNPADARERVRLTLRMSRDGGKTWPFAQVICPGWASYSDMQTLNGQLHLLYETGVNSPVEVITYETTALPEEQPVRGMF